ncbi:MAG: hypothetical protein JO072_09405 [Parafilimonas sp.]|nr:hypothetical protein [Parafilimonas sp.]
MRIIIACLVFYFTTSFCSPQNATMQLAIARVQYIYHAKKLTGNAAWAAYGSNQYNIPLIYYANDTTYIANPHEKFLNQFHPQLIFNTDSLKIYQLNRRIDEAPFHMQVSINFQGDTSAYDYFSPYMKCSSREEFEHVTGYATSTQIWASMVLHECFHGFQFLHKGYTEYAVQTGFIMTSIGDSLQQLYNSLQWFKQSADAENNLLLQAIKSSSKQETDSLVQQFFKLRNKRRLRTNSETKHNITLLEKCFETLEGTARFVEASSLENPLPDSTLSTIDTSFAIKQETSFKLPEYLYKTEISQRYFYTTGYNEIRLLQKMRIDYAAQLFNQPSVTAEDILHASIGSTN